MLENRRICLSSQPPRFVLASFGCLLFPLLVGKTFADDGRFSAALSDGTRISGTVVKGWTEKNDQPSLEGRAVFDEKNPFRWMINHVRSPASRPKAYVEFFGGDRLPGEVVGFRLGQESDYLDLPKHLIVDPAVALHSPRESRNLQVRVRTRWLKRVVWQPRTLELYDPGHVFFRDGRQLKFRSLRWANDSVTLLLEDGIREVFFDDLLEIHFPLPEVWSAYFEQMAVLSPRSALEEGGHARIVQLETSDGLRATVSTNRLQPDVHGNRNKSESWHHLCQPAWSLDPFWVRFDSVWSRRFFWPHKPPLTVIEPSSIRQKSPLGESWYWRRDRNVYRQSLQSGGKDFGWGFGVHAFHELAFPLPRSAEAFRVRAGLDESVGEGGCVRWEILLRGEDEKSLYRSPIVRGTDQVLETGRLNLPESAEESPDRQIVLTVDPMLTGAPAGADPLDIRDSLNWLEPELELDPERLSQELARHSLARIPALADWTLETDPARSAVLGNTWDDFDRDDPRYRELLGTQGRFLSLTKSIPFDNRDRWLVLAVNRPDDKSPPAWLQVHIDGAAVAELEIPAARDAKGPDPLLVPVEAYRERTVNVRLVMVSSPKAETPETADEILKSCVDWRGIATSSHRPGLLPLAKETAAFLEQLSEGEGTVSLDDTDPFSGAKCFKVTPKERGQSRLDDLQISIRSEPRLGEYRYLSFAWKKAGGDEIALGLAHHGKLGGENFGNPRPRGRRDLNARTRPVARARRLLESAGQGLQYGYQYRRGKSDTEENPAKKLDDKIPEDWQRVERDVFRDFGEFTLTGLSMIAFDGEAAWFDEIYLARDRRDFEHLPSRRREPSSPSDPNILREESRKEHFGLVSRGVLGPFAVSEAGGRVRLLKSFQGKTNVLSTEPENDKTPCRLRAPVVLPDKQKSRLELVINRHPEGEWKLIVSANGEKLKETVIGEDNAGEKWLEVSVDLSRFAGRPVMLEIQHAKGNGKNDAAYWSRAAIVH